MQESLLNDSRVLWSLRGDWLYSSCLFSIKNAMLFCRESGLQSNTSGWKQKVILKHLMSKEPAFDHCELYLRRLKRFFPIRDIFHVISEMFNTYRHFAKHFKPCILFAHIFTVCNHWCTRSRFGLPSNVCPFG